MREADAPLATGLLRDIWRALGGAEEEPTRVAFLGDGDLPSAFAVGDLAAASAGAAALATVEFAGPSAGRVRVDRRLASLWFAASVRPEGWSVPPAWDPVAGDYPARDGWIRLHTNAPHHRAAALAVLGAEPVREAVAAAVAGWGAEALEEAVVARGGCAAAMRSREAWAAHPQGRAVASEPLVRREGGDEAAVAAPVADPSRPLAGCRVLDLTRVLAGPVATRFLAGLGADVLRVDPPSWDEPGVVPDVTLGKRCARLDLRDPAARGRLLALLGGADVLVHGYRPGALEGFGLGPKERRAARPGLVEVSLDAYGWTGPWAARRGFDSLVQMSAGIAEAGMRAAGADRPVPLPVQALDHATGYVMAAAALRGLSNRRATGRGVVALASLARTAALLAATPRRSEGPPFAPAGDADFDPATERTPWGPARRLRPQVAIEGVRIGWDRPAAALGSSLPEW